MVDEIRVALAVDEKDGVEGVVAHMVGDQWFPLIAAEAARFEQIEIVAEIVAAQTGKEIRMVAFTNRKELKTIPARKKQ
jgi:hypothetical protein